MMGETAESRMIGDKILENYKKQLADRMAREKVTSMGDKSNRSDEF